mmetsp:Transcript_28162/g.27010  ORF Transcript_28162/g.27010 Transcript_28162/m.27010 type:complete len:410 (+) Transcript_28162:142-1371(+)|eukprot:CAMPEP_0119052946 /NCGR_PEP_ID=MMETSP1177-20130426/74081_1 /TAXON_ID=2985 /ORGANISM="Ochromonas sp, Strain CCMP1899" /LENGTH=409 /DNA_ID=CAMNT_0007032697 /DNA_START=81 /DNA_END=1310 /DNA_ORIENTATION=+
MTNLQPSPRPQSVLRGHKDSVNTVSFLSGELLSSGSADGILKIWNINSHRTLVSIDAHKGKSILSVNILFQSSSLLTCGRDGFVKLWRLTEESSPKFDEPFLSFRTDARHFCNASCDRGYLADPSMLLTPSAEESEISIWDIRSATKRVAVIKQNEKEKSGGLSDDKGMVFSLLLQSQHSNDRNGLKKIEKGDNKPVSGASVCDVSKCDSKIDGEPSLDMNVLSNSVPRLLAGYEDGSISCFDIRTLRSVHNIRPHQEPTMTMDLSPNGQYLASGGGDENLSIVHFNSIVLDPLKENLTEGVNQSNIMHNSTMEIKDCKKLPTKGVSSVKYRSDGRILVSGHWDNSVRIFDTKRMKPIAVLRHHRDKVFAVDFAPSYQDKNSHSRPGIFATGSKDGTIAVWNDFEETLV